MSAEISAQIRAMAGIFDKVYVIDPEKYAPDFTTDGFRSRYMLMGHLNAAGYQYIAWMFMTYINWIIGQSLPSFSDIGLVE